MLRSLIRWFASLCLSCFVLSAHALTEQEIQRFIDEAAKAGGGEVVIPPGTHNITKGLVFKDAKKIRLIGYDAEKSVLKLPPLAFAEISAAAIPGDKRLGTKRIRALSVGMRIQIEANGELDEFTKKPKPYQLAVIDKIEPHALVLKDALRFPVPAGTLIRDPNAPNLIAVRSPCENVTIEKLTLDGGRIDDDPPVHGHAELCGVFAQGPYSYEKGVTGPRVKALAIKRCVIQNCHGRGVALYSTEDCVVEDCTIMDTMDEAVDLDHFTIKAVVRHNHVARSGVGTELNDANDCIVSGNEFHECGIGINLWRFCKIPELNFGNQIIGNTFDGMKGNGIQISKDTMKNSVTDNEIFGSGRNGISVAGREQSIGRNRIERSKMKDIAENESGAIVPVK